MTEEINNVDPDLICILFPGIVKNEDRALQCLGGIRNISQVYSQSTKKRLGLCYQPDNPFIKKIYGDIKKTAGVLLKVKVKKTKADNEIKREVLSTSVVGRVSQIYKFESLCDFQYLPVQIKGNEKPQCILEQILPSGVDGVNFITDPGPLFIVPSNFTRSDRPTNYGYTEKRYPEKRESSDRNDDVHHRTRSERGLPLSRFSFNLVDDIPSEPHEYCIKQKISKVRFYPKLEQEFETVKKMFEERPIWSLNLIRYHTKIKVSSLKLIMPCLAVYMKDGPWRMLWVKFGYDPRKDPEARIYQTLDFRLRQAAGIRSMVMTRDQIVHCKKADRVRKLQRNRDDGSESTSDEIFEGAVYFRPGMAPSQRQIFYQLCDVKLPEVEQILTVKPPPGFLCHQTRGWLAHGVQQDCRDHIFKYVKETLLASHSADLKLEVSEQASSDESHSDDAEDAVAGAASSATEAD